MGSKENKEMYGNSVYLFIEISLVVLVIFACIFVAFFVFFVFYIIKMILEKKVENKIELAMLVILTIFIPFLEIEVVEVFKYVMRFLAEVT